MEMPVWRCVSCGREEPFREIYNCPRCHGELSLEFDYASLAKTRIWRKAWGQGSSLWERFSPLLPPITSPEALVTLGEGNTPLIRASRLSEYLGLKHLYLKLEQCNPTGSFKDRQIAIAFCKALEWGHKAYGIVSSGNAGISLAAFCARANCKANVWVHQGIPLAKLCQLRAYGAQVFVLPDPQTSGNMTKYYETYIGMQEFCISKGLVPMVTARRINPLAVEGAKTIAFEICLQLGRVPDKVFLPIGGGGLCGSTWKGFKEMLQVKLIDRLPSIFGAQYGGEQYLAIDKIQTHNLMRNNYYIPLDGAWAFNSIIESEGVYLGKVDKQVKQAKFLLSTLEGVFAESAGVASVAGLIEAVNSGLVRSDEWIVCYITGHGLKESNVEINENIGGIIQVENLESSSNYVKK
ncbi:MAG: pyridoxal-phosphate dependent enzyme [Thermoproteota archaeon]